MAAVGQKRLTQEAAQSPVEQTFPEAAHGCRRTETVNSRGSTVTCRTDMSRGSTVSCSIQCRCWGSTVCFRTDPCVQMQFFRLLLGSLKGHNHQHKTILRRSMISDMTVTGQSDFRRLFFTQLGEKDANFISTKKPSKLSESTQLRKLVVSHQFS